jgi:hypothetical protein
VPGLLAWVAPVMCPPPAPPPSPVPPAGGLGPYPWQQVAKTHPINQARRCKLSSVVLLVVSN